MKSKPLVFISSTSDLVEERQAVTAALRPDYEPYLFEEDRAARRSPMEHCRGMIGRSDVWVGILGSRYGSTFGADRAERSIVEWEFDTAREHPALELMLFVRSGIEGGAIDPRQREFLDRVQSFDQGAWCKFFGSTGELISLLRKSLEKWLIEFYVQIRRAQPRLAQWLRRWTTSIACVAGVLSVAVVAMRELGVELGRAWLFGLLGLGAATILLCLILVWSELGGEHG